jgi:Sap, sulfolipid-1-addressing protein
MNVAAMLPLAVVMIAGPQIISSIFFATSEKWKGDSANYVAGAAVSITAIYTAAYFIFKGAKQSGGSHSGSTAHTIDVVILVLLLFAMFYTFRRRKTSEPPKWMNKLQTASLRLSFNLGLVLLGVFPTDIATSVSVGARLSNQSEPWVGGVPFILLVLLLLGLPALLVLILGKKAEAFLPKVRDWMNDNSWIVSECVLVFIIVIISKSLAS